MGSGASKRANQRRASQSRRKHRGRDAEANITDPSLLRRRRVLFCAAEPDCILQFERVSPIKQYAAAIPDEDDDPVFERFGGSNEANDFRRRADQMRYEQDDGYLREDAIELLGLGLRPDSILSRRLFRIAQAQVVYSSDNRRPLMTCYELLALYSVLRHGTSSELLELLFCVFDADDDDRVSIPDLTIAIDAFQEFAEPGSVQHYSSKRVSQKAVDGINAFGASEDKESSEADHDGVSDDDVRSVSSKTPLAGDNKPRKQRRCGFCCGGRAPADSDDAPEPRKAKPKSRAARRGLCCSCGAGSKKEVPALNFDQWQHWVSTSDLLPAGFAQEYGMPPPSRGAMPRGRANSASKLRMTRSSSRSDDDDESSD